MDEEVHDRLLKLRSDVKSKQDKIGKLRRYVELLEDEVKNAVRNRAVNGPMACNSEQADHLASQTLKHLREFAGIDRDEQLTYCAFCGTQYVADGSDNGRIAEHIATCEQHPMRETERVLQELQHENNMLIEAIHDVIGICKTSTFFIDPAGSPEHELAGEMTKAIVEKLDRPTRTLVQLMWAERIRYNSYMVGLSDACEAVGPWLSAAQEDPKVCPEMKKAIEIFFKNFEPKEKS